jgi:hypothetical protein
LKEYTENTKEIPSSYQTGQGEIGILIFSLMFVIANWPSVDEGIPDTDTPRGQRISDRPRH